MLVGVTGNIFFKYWPPEAAAGGTGCENGVEGLSFSFPMRFWFSEGSLPRLQAFCFKKKKTQLLFIH